jgi:lipoprotein-anchoring transpeptidase ErfK/SrfK
MELSISTPASAATSGHADKDAAKARSLSQRGRLVAAGGLATALLMSSAAFSDASAFLFDWGGQPPAPNPAPLKPTPKLNKPRHKRVDKIDPNEKKLPALATGTLQVVIAINSQRLTLYSNGVPVAHSMVATGVPGHPTPTGVFSVIQKERFHRSNLYSDAPMPFMQRITWSGVALHEGVVPGHPASHGCIRMPAAFARQMWATTKLGLRVIIARTDVLPAEIEHPHLFVPKQPEAPTPREMPVADQPAQRAEAGPTVKTAEVTDRTTVTDAVELRGSVKDGLPAAKAHPMAHIWTAVMTAAERLTGGIVTAEAAVAAKLTDIVANANTIAVAKKAADHIKKVEAMRKAGPISVFISRKEKKLFVRHKFTPLFDVPVTIRDATRPLGTHVYSAVELKDGGAAMRWTVVSMPTEAESQAEPPKKQGRKSARAEHEQAPPPAAVPSPAAIAALDRIEISKEARDRISELLTVGASLTISDQGLGPETGRGTDFIVVTR